MYVWTATVAFGVVSVAFVSPMTAAAAGPVAAVDRAGADARSAARPRAARRLRTRGVTASEESGEPQLTGEWYLRVNFVTLPGRFRGNCCCGGLIPLAAGAVVLAVLAGVLGGLPGLVAAVVGALLAAAALAVGPGLMAWSARSAPQLALVMGLMGYAVTIILLGVVLLVLRTSSWLDHGYLAAGLGARHPALAGRAGLRRSPGCGSWRSGSPRPGPGQNPTRAGDPRIRW